MIVLVAVDLISSRLAKIFHRTHFTSIGICGVTKAMLKVYILSNPGASQGGQT